MQKKSAPDNQISEVYNDFNLLPPFGLILLF